MADRPCGTLTPEQLQDLREHLRSVLDGEALGAAVSGIAIAATDCVSWNQADHDAGRIQGHRARMRVVKAADQLKAALESPDDMPPSAEISWDDFVAALSRIATAARWEAEYLHPRSLPVLPADVQQVGFRPRRAPGRPVDKGRDRLVLRIRSFYRHGEPRQHFFETVEMVLDFIDRGREDLRGTIEGALRREAEAERERRTLSRRRADRPPS